MITRTRRGEAMSYTPEAVESGVAGLVTRYIGHLPRSVTVLPGGSETFVVEVELAEPVVALSGEFVRALEEMLPSGYSLRVTRS